MGLELALQDSGDLTIIEAFGDDPPAISKYVAQSLQTLRELPAAVSAAQFVHWANCHGWIKGVVVLLSQVLVLPAPDDDLGHTLTAEEILREVRIHQFGSSIFGLSLIHI